MPAFSAAKNAPGRRAAGRLARVIHVRIVAPAEQAEQALELLDDSEAVCNVIHLAGAARRPERDVILADVAREDASVVLADLKALGIPRDGSIAIEEIDTQISDQADRAIKRARGAPADAVVWEEVEQHTSENVELSGVFLAFMVIAAQLAMVGIFQDSAILIVGAMVVGPEFGPLAGFCVAAVQRRPQLALRSALALGAGFPLAITGVWLATLAGRATGVFPDDFSTAEHGLANIISDPDFLSFFVAVCAGVAGHAQPVDGQVRRADRRAHLGHDDPGRRQHRDRGGVPRGRRLAREHGAAGDQPLRDRARRRDDAGVQRALYRRRKTRHEHEHDHAHEDRQSVDQISTFVRTFSITASVNSTVPALPPRSIVLTPPAVVSSVAS